MTTIPINRKGNTPRQIKANFQLIKNATANPAIDMASPCKIRANFSDVPL